MPQYQNRFVSFTLTKHRLLSPARNFIRANDGVGTSSIIISIHKILFIKAPCCFLQKKVTGKNNKHAPHFVVAHSFKSWGTTQKLNRRSRRLNSWRAEWIPSHDTNVSAAGQPLRFAGTVVWQIYLLSNPLFGFKSWGTIQKLNRRSRRLNSWRAIGIQSSNPLFAELRRSAQYICKSNILACIQAIVESDV